MVVSWIKMEAEADTKQSNDKDRSSTDDVRSMEEEKRCAQAPSKRRLSWSIQIRSGVGMKRSEVAQPQLGGGPGSSSSSSRTARRRQGWGSRSASRAAHASRRQVLPRG